MGRQTTVDLTGQTLGVGPAAVLGAGVYNFDTTAELDGILTLTGNDTDVFVFKIGSTLTTASASSIVLGGTVDASNVFFVVGSSATLGTTTAFQGQILALTSISLNNSATIDCGAAWARNGAVTLDTNTIGICTFAMPAGILGTTLAGTTTTNQQAVIDAIDAYVAGGGTLPLAFEVLALLSPEELAEALGQMSGETGTGAAPAGNQAMNSFIDVLFGAPGTERTIVSREVPDDNTVSVMGYTDGSEANLSPALASVAIATRMQTPNIDLWTIWGAAYGSQSSVDGNLSVGSHAATTSDFGYTIGFERHVTADTMFGFAITSGGTNFDLAESLGSGASAMLQAAVYSRTNLDQAYISSAIAYGLHDVTIERTLNVGGEDRYRSQFLGQDGAVAVEAGYDTGWLTPYVGGRVQAYVTPGYSEQTLSGVNTFALDYAGQISLTARTEIGVKFHAGKDFDGGRISLNGGAAWAHTFWGDNTANASFQMLPGSTFTVAGATPAADHLLLSGGLGAQFDNGFSVGGSVGADLALNAHTYKASVRMGYTF